MTTQNNLQNLLSEIANRTAELRDAINKYDNAPKDGSSYLGNFSHARRLAAEIGLENVFYVGENYRGLYEDDYCTFTFYNNLTGELFYDEWTTAYACPPCDSYYEGIYTIKEGLELGLIDMDKVFTLNKKRFETMIENNAKEIFSIDSIRNNCFYPRVKVNGGRKWKGEGYLIDMKTSIYHFGPSYGKGYNTSSTTTAKILSIEDFQIHYCNADYLEFVEQERIEKMYIDWSSSIIGKLFRTVDDAKYYFNCDALNWKLLPEVKEQFDFSINRFFEYNDEMVNHILRMNTITANAYDAKEFERKVQYSQRLAEQLPNVIEWVKTNTDKTSEEDVLELALHILNKRN